MLGIIEMKTFREMISWELEQEKKGARTLQITTEEVAGKLGSCILRKVRHLSSDVDEQLKSPQTASKNFC
jgi:hypothetical protein